MELKHVAKNQCIENKQINDDIINLIKLKKIIFDLTNENFDTSVRQTLKLLDLNFPNSINFIIANLIYYAFYSQKKDVYLYLNYLKTIQIKEEEINSNNKITLKIVEIFINKLQIGSQESYYFIDKMIKLKLISEDIVNSIQSNYFIHYQTKENKKIKYNAFENNIEKKFRENYLELSKNNWELHKKLIEEGVNPNKIAKIIRNDEIEKLQEISSQTNFDYNQTIEPSFYERCSFINKENVSLIDYAAFFGSVKCFKYLLTNGANVKNTGKYAVASGNLEIIHLCEQNHSSFVDAYETAIEFHRNDIFYYLYENKYQNIYKHSQKSPPRSEDINPLFFIDCGTETLTESEKRQKSITNFVYFCIMSGNFEILLFLEKEGMNILLI